jgi:mediator of RNA polymerase II transcription subunit 13, fungi type
MTLASPVLRQVFSAVKKALKTHSEAQILFQFVPEQLILSYMGNPSANFSDLEAFCASLYDRILLPVNRQMSRRLFEHSESVCRYFQEPAFTLARPMHTKVSFIRAPRAPLDVMDRYTFVHIGYQVSPCGKWILAACVDQRGEAHDLGVWLTQTPGEGGESEVEVSKETFLVKKVWEFAIQFAKRANAEWRLVLSKLGAMGEIEVEGGIDLCSLISD